MPLRNCPECKAGISFQPIQGTIKCPHCDTTLQVNGSDLSLPGSVSANQKTSAQTQQTRSSASMYGYERSYRTARAVFGFLEFCAWISVLIGVLLAIGGFATGGIFSTISQQSHPVFRIMATIPGLGVALGGLFTVAFVQIGRASVDSAEMTREMLKLARET